MARFSGGTTPMSSSEKVDWVLDAGENSEDETAPAVTVRKIPRFHEHDWMDDEFQKKFDAKFCTTISSTKVEKLLKKSVIAPGFEQLKSVPTPSLSRRASRRERKKERDLTKGPGWYNLPAQEVTEDVKNDLDLLRMRSFLDPRHFYKKNDLTHTPKYFQIGTVLETPADFYNSRIPKAQRKRSLVSELMADAESRAFQKKKYKSIVDSSRHKSRKSKPKDTKKKTKKSKSSKK